MPRSKASSKATTIGHYGHEVLGLLYRYGGLTRYQLARLTGLSLAAVGRQTTHLRRAGMVAIARDSAVWKDRAQGAPKGRPYSVYYLTAPTGARAGGRAVGLEYDRAALRNYRRIQLPATAAHRVAANEYLITLREAAASAGLDMPYEEVFSEASPEFPLFGSGRPKTQRRDTSYRYTAIVPDASFVLGTSSGEQRFYLELEAGLRTPQVVAKLRDYTGRWRRKLAPNEGEIRWHDPEARLEPVVLITANTSHARSLHRSLYERLPQAEGYGEATDAISAAAGARVDPRKLVLVAGWDEVKDNPLGRVYRPLRKYPEDASEEGGWQVGLADAAEVAARITPPDMETAKKYVEEEAEKEVAS